MEQVVLNPQNQLEQLHLLADSQPAQGSPSIPEHLTKAYETHPLPGKVSVAIRKNESLGDITVAGCREELGKIRYRGSVYVPEHNALHLRIIQEPQDTVFAGHPRRAKIFDLLDQEYYWKGIGQDVDLYVRNCHSCQ